MCHSAFCPVFVGRQIIKTMKPLVATNVDVSDILKGPQMAAPAGGGGGGGSHDIVDPMKGKLPPRMKDSVTPPMVQLHEPKLTFTRPWTLRRTSPSRQSNLPNFGVKHSANVTLASNGNGAKGDGQWVQRRSWIGQLGTATDCNRRELWWRRAQGRGRSVCSSADIHARSEGLG